MLTPAEEGFYTLKPSTAWPRRPPGRPILPGSSSPVRSAPSIKRTAGVAKVPQPHPPAQPPGGGGASRRLERVGNIHSDGRPILGLDSRDLLELTLTACPEAVFIPRPISGRPLLPVRAFSGFQTMEECFEDLTPHIHAVETGLSSDPPMNWQSPP